MGLRDLPHHHTLPVAHQERQLAVVVRNSSHERQPGHHQSRILDYWSNLDGFDETDIQLLAVPKRNADHDCADQGHGEKWEDSHHEERANC